MVVKLSPWASWLTGPLLPAVAANAVLLTVGMAVTVICIGVDGPVGIVALFELQATKRRRKKTHNP
jgi:hypothetical protein